MSKLCPKCGQVVDDELNKCPFCNEEFNTEEQDQNDVDDVLEVPSQDTNETETKAESESPKVEEKVDIPIQENNVSTDAANIENVNNESSEVEKKEIEQENIPSTSSDNDVKAVSNIPVSDSSTVSFEQEVPTEKSEANETSDTIVTNENVLEEVSVSDLDNVSVDSSNLETVSIDATDDQLVDKEEIVQNPELPEPTIGEVNVDLLSNKYEEEEKINNEKIMEKKRLKEEERLRNEEEMKNRVMEKPDLLAASTPQSTEVSENGGKMKKSKNSNKNKHLLNVLTIVIVIVVALVLIWYFLIRDPDGNNNDNYMTPIVSWFKGYKDGNATTMLSAYVPCLAKSDEVMNSVNDTVNNRLTYKSFYLEYKEDHVEIINESDQNILNDYLKGICNTNIPEIKDYKHVYINEKVSNTSDNKYEETHPEFYVVQIDNKWYVLALQEAIGIK